MKRKLYLVLLGLGLLAPTLAGCPGKTDPVNPPEPEDHASPDIPTPEEINLNYFEIETIDHTTYTFTIADVRGYMLKVGLTDNVLKPEMLLKILNSSKFGKAQADKFFDIVAFAQKLNMRDTVGLSKTIESVLSLLNSLTSDQLSSLLSVVSEEVRNEQRAAFDEADYEPVNYFRDYYSRLGGMDKKEAEQLLKIVEGEKDNSEYYEEAKPYIEDALDTFGSMNFTAEQIAEANQAKADALKKLNEQLIPQYVIDYAKNNTESFIASLTKYIQAIGSVVLKKYIAANEGYHIPYQGGIDIKLDGYNAVLPVNSLKDFTNLFTVSDIKNIVKACVGKADENKVIFDFARKVGFPLLFELAGKKDNAEISAKRREWLNKLNELEITAYDNFAKFLVNALDFLNDESYADLSSGDLVKVVTRIKNNLPFIRLAISSQDEHTKEQITKLTNLFGIDLFAILDAELNYIEGVELATDAQKEACKKHFDDLGEDLSNKFNDAFISLVNGEEPEEDVEYYVSLTHDLYVGDNVSKSTVNEIGIYDYSTSPSTRTSIKGDLITGFEIDTSKYGFATGRLTYKLSEDASEEQSLDYRFFINVKKNYYFYDVYAQKSYDQNKNNKWIINRDESGFDDHTLYFGIYYCYDIPSLDVSRYEVIEREDEPGLILFNNDSFEVFANIYMSLNLDCGYDYFERVYLNYYLGGDEYLEHCEKSVGYHEYYSEEQNQVFEYEVAEEFEEVLGAINLDDDVIELESGVTSLKAVGKYYNKGQYVTSPYGPEREIVINVTNFVNDVEAKRISFEYEGETYLFVDKGVH